MSFVIMIISWDDHKFISQLWSSVNYKFCKLLLICLQRPLYFLNVPNYNWLPYNNSFASKSNTHFDIDGYKIWSSMFDLVSFLSKTFNICRLSDQLTNGLYNDRVTRNFFCHLVHTSSERCWILLQRSSLLSSL